MKTRQLPQTDLTVSRIAYGCGMLAGWDKSPLGTPTIDRAEHVIKTAYDHGVTLFDHADVYGFGRAEEAFGEVLRRSPGLRNRIVLQTKCGQCLPGDPNPGDPFRANLSHDHIVSSVEGSLKRLRTDRVDLLLLHITDALMETEEVARAFDQLQQEGKVRYFGVSNHSPTQIARLRHSVRQPLVVNQIQLGLSHCHAIVEGMEFLLETTRALPKMLKGVKSAPLANAYAGLAGPGILDYCAMQGIQIQAWSPVRGDLLKPPAEATPQAGKLVRALADLSRVKGVAASAIALAWLLRHPAGILPIIGSMNPEHLKENCAADGLELTRDEWYALFDAAADIRAQRRGPD